MKQCSPLTIVSSQYATVDGCCFVEPTNKKENYKNCILSSLKNSIQMSPLIESPCIMYIRDLDAEPFIHLLESTPTTI